MNSGEKRRLPHIGTEHMKSMDPHPPSKEKEISPHKVHLARIHRHTDTEITKANLELPSITNPTTLPSLKPSNHEKSDINMDIQQRLARLELDHDNDHMSSSDDRCPNLPLDEYMAYANSMDLSRLRLHHAKLFKLVRRYQALFSVASGISVEVDSHSAITRIVDGVKQVLPVERVVLFFINKSKQTLCGIEGQVVLTGKSIMIENASSDPSFHPQLDIKTNFTTSNVLCVPVTDPKNKPVAVLSCSNKSTPFTSGDCLSIELIAMIAGHTLYKLELFDSAINSGRRTSAILQVVKAVAEDSNDTNALILKVLHVIKCALNCDRVTLYLCNHVKQELISCVSKDTMLERFSMTYDKGLAGYVASTGQVISSDNCYNDPRFNPDIDIKSGYKTITAVVAPVVSPDGETVAVMQALNKSTLPIPEHFNGTVPISSIIRFSDSDIQLLVAFCHEMGTSLRRSTLEMMYHKVFQDVNQLTRRDSVTLMVNSLIGVHSNDKANSSTWGIKGWKISGLVTLAATKFMKTLTKRREKPREDPTPFIRASHTTLHCNASDWREKLSGFDDFTFDIFSCTQEQLAFLVVEGLTQLGLLGIFSVPYQIAVDFVQTVKSRYRDNPYHSWWHGADVFQHVFALLNRTDLLSMMQPNIVFSMLIAALCHDIDHPGTDNAYEIATGSALAMKYNDISVLEQHHASETFRILQNSSYNLLCGMSKPAYQTIRKLIIDGILQTDMKCHFDLVHDLEDAILRRQKEQDIFDLTNPIHVKWLTGSILHASDIGAQTYPVEIAGQWSVRLVEEFRLLGEKEQAQGIPIAPFRDKLNTKKAVGRLQLNFINYIVTPLWHLVMDVFPATSILKINLDANRRYFQQMILEDNPLLCDPPNTLRQSTSATTLHTSPSKAEIHRPPLSSSNEHILSQQLSRQLSMAHTETHRNSPTTRRSMHSNQSLCTLENASQPTNRSKSIRPSFIRVASLSRIASISRSMSEDLATTPSGEG